MPANPALKPEDCNCFVVRSAARHVTQLYDQFLAPVGLHVTQFSILAKLKRLGPMTINGLAKEMVMDRTTLGRNVLPLERDGLISIEASAIDGRAKQLHLSKAGEKRLLVGREAWAQAQARRRVIRSKRHNQSGDPSGASSSRQAWPIARGYQN